MDIAIYNPKEKDIDDLPTIYGFNNTKGSGFDGISTCMQGILVAEDGTALGTHICSSEEWMHSDLGIIMGSAPNRHDEFRAHYPNGYKMEFVPSTDIDGHTGLKKALDNNDNLRLKKEPV